MRSLFFISDRYRFVRNLLRKHLVTYPTVRLSNSRKESTKNAIFLWCDRVLNITSAIAIFVSVYVFANFTFLFKQLSLPIP
ncbi:hypothetical protein [Geitlerinema sp. PCC 9228]|uniref:hypothetical protein n=1 Tax=Geitlerinema sp. PCC 9228 TaxID=111611 RepID=UPI0008F9A4B7|nr:hypothetical protein [Geitlerinema sp. PCC 9228]